MKSRASRIAPPSLFLAAILIIGLNTWIALRALSAVEYNQFWVEHTWQVIYSVERVVSVAKDAETGTRGFLLTSDPAYLDEYRTAVHQLPRELDTCERLVADNPPQVLRVASIRRELNERMATLEESVSRHRAREMKAHGAEGTSDAVTLHMGQLRLLANDAEAEEKKLLGFRTAKARASARNARLAIFFASGLDLLLMGFVFRHFLRERTMRLESERVAADLALSRVEIERNAAEIQLLNVTLEDRVQQRTVELETTNRELEAFSYSVSHDLRAPLRTIDGFSLALEEDYADLIDAAGRDYIRRVRAGVQRMGQLIDALLQLSRITRAEITREEVDLTALAESVVESLREENRGREFEITVDRGMEINADPKLLRVALENLFNNAAKFSSKKAESIIHFGWDAEEQAWFVRDNGAGFDMHYAGKLFNAFNRLHGDKDFKGSGIGLATVARVIHRHHGRIWGEGEVDHGATFWFTVR